MTDLIMQALDAQSIGLYQSWYDGLSDKDRKQYEQEIANVTDAITVAFRSFGVTFDEVVQAAVAACAGLAEYVRNNRSSNL